MSIAILTASIGANELTEPTKDFPGHYSADYYAFVDESKMGQGGIWNRQLAFQFSSDPSFGNRRNAKIYKILPHLFVPGYDYYIWIDSTHQVAMDPNQIINTYLNDSDIALFKHPERNCVAEEGELIKQVNFDHHNLVQEQMDFYFGYEKYPSNNGLYELPCRVQRNSRKIQEAMLLWWEQICMFSSRDQLSLPYVLWKNDIKPAIMPGKANGLWENEILPQCTTSTHLRNV